MNPITAADRAMYRMNSETPDSVELDVDPPTRKSHVPDHRRYG